MTVSIQFLFENKQQQPLKCPTSINQVHHGGI